MNKSHHWELHSSSTYKFWKCRDCSANGGPVLPHKINYKGELEKHDDWMWYGTPKFLVSWDCNIAKQQIENYIRVKGNHAF